MQYNHVKEQEDYSDLASGRVFYSLSGHPAFPVRLASEIFQRCITSRKKLYNSSTPCTLYDPCCGAAYHLSVLAYLHGESIREIIGSDIDEKAVALASQNLGLLSVAGLDKRISEISKMFELYNKDSHKDALASGYVLKNKISALGQERDLITKVFQASATDSKTMINNINPKSVDIVFTDIPYGQHSHWHGLNPNELLDPVSSMLSALIEILSPSSIVAIISDKQQKVAHKDFQRVEQFQVGKRRVVILKPI
ncbi:MAG: methyltransferase domain-containing protein [Anaerolineales bacterium]